MRRVNMRMKLYILSRKYYPHCLVFLFFFSLCYGMDIQEASVLVTAALKTLDSSFNGGGAKLKFPHALSSPSLSSLFLAYSLQRHPFRYYTLTPSVDHVLYVFGGTKPHSQEVERGEHSGLAPRFRKTSLRSTIIELLRLLLLLLMV